MRELPRGEDAGGDQQNAFAALVHADSLALSPFVRYWELLGIARGVGRQFRQRQEYPDAHLLVAQKPAKRVRTSCRGLRLTSPAPEAQIRLLDGAAGVKSMGHGDLR
jgi:hypothetical protein